MKVFMFNHSGSLNRGCEAIVRGTVNILDKTGMENEYILSSYSPCEDEKLKDIVRVVPFKPGVLNKAEHIAAALKIRLCGDERYSVIKSYSGFFKEAEAADICLSVGGDTYCYGDNPVIRILTGELKRRGKKTVLWGASVGEEDLTADKEKNLAGLDAIFAREPLTFELLNKKINMNIFQFPDPAFTLEKEELPLPEGWLENNTVGINISSIVCERNPTLKNSVSGFIKHILDKSDMSIALIPHATAPNNDDIPVLEQLAGQYKNDPDGRVFILPRDLSAGEYKGYISRLRFFIGSRTHATIAAYTCCIPTIVLGYSVKSRGIARDLFGYERFVLDSKNVSGSELKEAFDDLREKEYEVINILRNVIPGKVQAAFEAGKKLNRLI